MLWLLCNGCVRSAQVARLWRVVSLREVTATQVAFTHACMLHSAKPTSPRPWTTSHATR